MARMRLHKADRRSSILEAATKVFAEFGFDGAKTQKIAVRAKVSEALIFQHFPSKEALYRAVLRKMIRDQDTAFKAMGGFTPDAAGLVRLMYGYFGSCLRGDGLPGTDSIRILYASLAGDGTYARLAHRRAQRLSVPPLVAALNGARAAGHLKGRPVDPANLMALIEHIGSNLCIGRRGVVPIVAYVGDDEQLTRETVLFCARGIGLDEEVVIGHLEMLSPSTA